MIRWQKLSKDALPAALFGEGLDRSSWLPLISPPRIDFGDVMLGFDAVIGDEGYAPPGLIVVNDKTSAELFSWVRVYAPEASPLSQFARIVSNDDWHRFTPGLAHKRSVTRSDSWASVIVGELLAQGESPGDLSTIPLSRAAACFTTAVARASILNESEEAVSATIERLRVLEADRRFARRVITVSELTRAWNVVGSMQVHVAPDQVAKPLMDSVLADPREPDQQRTDIRFPDFSGLDSDSVEERLVSFQKIADRLQEQGYSRSSGPILATAAFLVGRGTTHVFLLRRLAHVVPSALIWFGVIAALTGPKSWDATWAHAAKGIERSLRTKFDWTDSPTADLSWSEFQWMALTFDGLDVFLDMPKIFSRVLSIEVTPGANCQLRLVPAGSLSESEAKPAMPLGLRERELSDVLGRFVDLAARARHLVEQANEPSGNRQRDLDLDNRGRDRGRPGRGKRGP